MMNGYRKMSFVFIVIGFLLSVTTSFAAPPPNEVEERKNEAPLYLIGTVVADDLFKDLTTDEKYPNQLRRMRIEVDRLLKAPVTEKETKSLEVYYSYIPSWQAKEYSGGERMDVAIGDVIEIWLTDGEYGLEPALGGNTVEHIKYTEDRNEPIPEPFLHFIERKYSSILNENVEAFVLTVLSLILFFIVVKAMKAKK